MAKRSKKREPTLGSRRTVKHEPEVEAGRGSLDTQVVARTVGEREPGRDTVVDPGWQEHDRKTLPLKELEQGRVEAAGGKPRAGAGRDTKRERAAEKGAAGRAAGRADTQQVLVDDEDARRKAGPAKPPPMPPDVTRIIPRDRQLDVIPTEQREMPRVFPVEALAAVLPEEPTPAPAPEEVAKTASRKRDGAEGAVELVDAGALPALPAEIAKTAAGKPSAKDEARARGAARASESQMDLRTAQVVLDVFENQRRDAWFSVNLKDPSGLEAWDLVRDAKVAGTEVELEAEARGVLERGKALGAKGVLGRRTAEVVRFRFEGGRVRDPELARRLFSKDGAALSEDELGEFELKVDRAERFVQRAVREAGGDGEKAAARLQRDVAEVLGAQKLVERVAEKVAEKIVEKVVEKGAGLDARVGFGAETQEKVRKVEVDGKELRVRVRGVPRDGEKAGVLGAIGELGAELGGRLKAAGEAFMKKPEKKEAAPESERDAGKKAKGSGRERQSQAGAPKKDPRTTKQRKVAERIAQWKERGGKAKGKGRD